MNINSRYSIIFSFAFFIATQLISQPMFIDRGVEFGLVESYSDLPLFGGGLSVKDFDGDGWDDITICTGAGRPIKFYKNQFGQGFEEAFPIITPSESQFFSCWIDFDGDNDLDFFIVSSNNGVRLYANDGNMNYSDITNISGLSNLGGVARRGCAFGDYNNDGLIDLYLPQSGYVEENKMFFQDINNVFQDVSNISNTGDSLKATFQGVLIDYNQDGWVDLYLANDVYGGNTLFRNNGDSTFTDVSAATGAYQELDAMGLAVGDFDNDLDLDIHITDKIDSKLLELTAQGTFNEVGTQRGVDFPLGFGWGNNFFDADLDGDEDLYVSSSYYPVGLSEPSVLYMNDGLGNFTGLLIGADSAYSFTNVVGDFNNDRKTDIAVLNSNGDPMKLWVNETMVNASRITLGLEGCQSNIEAAGARVIAYDGADSRLYSYHVSQSFLGQNSDKKIIPILNGNVLDSLKIIWPLGGTSTLHQIEPDQTLMVNECSTPRPVPVVMVPNYSTQGLVLCSGDSILLTVNGDYPSVTWSNGETSNSIYVTSPGNYFVSVTNQYGISANSQSVEIIEREYPAYSIEYEIASCYNNGFIQITPSDSNSQYTYTWSNNSTSNNIVDLTPNTYLLTITDQGECAVYETIVIDGPANYEPIYFNAQSSNALCYGENSGLITLQPTGGSEPYTFLWSNNETDSALNVAAGNYSVTLTDFYGCDKDTLIGISQPDQILSFIDVSPDTNLTGVGSILLQIFGGTPPYSVNWSNAQSGDQATNLIAGAYSAEIIDNNLCDRVLQINVPNVQISGLQDAEGTSCSLKCIVADGVIQLGQMNNCGNKLNNNSIEVYNSLGQSVSFDLDPITDNTSTLYCSESGMLIIRNSQNNQTCKVLRP
jgi:hypothetical protein